MIPRALLFALTASLTLGGCVRYLKLEAEKPDAGVPGSDGPMDAPQIIDGGLPDGPLPDSPLPDSPREQALPPNDSTPPLDLPPNAMMKYVHSASASPTTATCPAGHVALSGGTLCGINSFVKASAPKGLNSWVSVCTGATLATYVSCAPMTAFSKVLITPVTTTAGANVYFSAGCLGSGQWEVGGGCSCTAGELISSVGPSNMTPGADPGWRCACSKAGAHQAVSICISSTEFTSLGITRSRNIGQNPTVNTVCKGGMLVLGGGCSGAPGTAGVLLSSQPKPTSWSCGFSKSGVHTAEVYCVNPKQP